MSSSTKSHRKRAKPRVPRYEEQPAVVQDESSSETRQLGRRLRREVKYAKSHNSNRQKSAMGSAEGGGFVQPTSEEQSADPENDGEIDWMQLGAISLIAFTELGSLTLIRKYVETKDKRYLAGGVLGYAGVALQLPNTMKKSGLGSVNIAWNGMSSVLGVAIGAALFQEKVYKLDYLGIPLTILGSMLVAKNHT